MSDSKLYTDRDPADHIADASKMVEPTDEEILDCASFFEGREYQIMAEPEYVFRASDLVTTVREILERYGAQPVPYKDSVPDLHVGESSFESWFSNYSPAGKGDKQRARDAYAAGMGDPLVTRPQAAAYAVRADHSEGSLEMVDPSGNSGELPGDPGTYRLAEAQRPGYGYHDGENPPNSILYQLMAPYHLNLCRGQELRSVIDFGRDVWRRALTKEQQQREEALRRAIGLLGMAVARLGPEDHEIRDRIQGFICPAADSDQQQGEQNA